MLAKVLSAAVIGMEALPVEVEVDVLLGIPMVNFVGLADAAVKESKERVRSGITNSGYSFPLKRIIVNLAPADIRKEGPYFDLSIAVGILYATEQIKSEKLSEYYMAGELSLTGELRRITGALIIAICAKETGKKGVILPRENAQEASIVEGIEIIPVSSLKEVIDFLQTDVHIAENYSSAAAKDNSTYDLDYADVKGQIHVKRALEIAAAGGHNILLIGPPGSGKTMLASRLPSILPRLTLGEAIEVTKVYSVAGMLKNNQALVSKRPFREPHHTISHAGLIGGGNSPRPGEVSLAHNGILFLDEFTEFSKGVLQVLRQPLEEGSVTISRALASLTYPARFTLVGAMNPCPCGHLGDKNKECICTPLQIQKYRGRISGPLLDRIDIHVEVPPVPKNELLSSPEGEQSSEIKIRIEAARTVQQQRFKETTTRVIRTNAQMKTKEVRRWCKMSSDASDLLSMSIDRLGLSGRAYERILKVSRTIADLSDEDLLSAEHVAEAVQYRALDRAFY